MTAKLIEKRSGREFPVEEDGTTLGRHGDNAVTLPGRAVSRFHAEIRLEKEGWIIEDQGSTYGTFVNGRKVEGTAPLQDGDAIRLAVTEHAPEGEFNLTFHAEAKGGLGARLKRAVRSFGRHRREEAGEAKIERAKDALVVRLSGVLRRREIDTFAAAIKRDLGPESFPVVVDLTEVDHLNSYGLATLVALGSRQKERGSSLRIFGATGTVAKVLLVPGEAAPFERCESEDEALAARGEAPGGPEEPPEAPEAPVEPS